MQIHDYLKSLYGFSTHEVLNPVTDTVATTATQIAKQNPNRVSMLVINLSANTLYINISNVVSSTNGIYIAPNGGSFVSQLSDDFSLPAREWYAIAGAAGSSIMVLELIAE